MKYLLRNALLIFLLALLVNCTEDELTSRDYPRLNTLAVKDITSKGAEFNAEIIFRGNFEIINYGFVWRENKNPILEFSDRVIYSENIQSNEFSEIIDITLKEGVSYFVRAFIETNEFIVYGENVNFNSLGSNGPELIDFTPKSGHLGEVVTITGENFGRIDRNVKVQIGGINASIISHSQYELTVITPSTLTNENPIIIVSLAGNDSEFHDSFNLYKPEIINITPTDANFESLIEITGNNFYSGRIDVFFVNSEGLKFQAEVSSLSFNRLVVKIPQLQGTGQFKIMLVMNNLETISAQEIAITN
ncbi:MAG: IPT/TIG domain-containing protein [Cyclobacteriaceae bacterium]